MRKNIFFFCIIIFLLNCITFELSAQVGINTISPSGSAMLDIYSSDKGLLIPRISEDARNQIPSPATGLLIYNSTTNLFNYYDGSFWYQIDTTFISSTTGPIRSGGGVSISKRMDKLPDSSAMLDASDSTRGFLITRTTTGSIANPVNGLIIFDISSHSLKYYTNSKWVPVCAVSTEISGADGSQNSVGVAINTNGASPHHSAIVDVSSTNKGVLIPRLTSAERNAISPVAGLTIFNIETNEIEFFNGSKWFRMNVMVPTGITISANLAPVCAGTPVDFTSSITNGGQTPKYQWFVNDSPVTGATNSTFSHSSASSFTVFCKLTSSSPCATDNPANSAPISITVNPLLPVSIVITASANPVCPGTSVTFNTTLVNEGAAPLFQWYVNGTAVSGATNAVYNFTPVNNDSVRCILTSSETCATGNPAGSNKVTMIVNQIGQVDQPTSQVVCNNLSTTAVVFTTSNSGGTTTYAWTNDQSSIGLASSGTGNINAFTAVNTGAVPVVATIVVTPTFTNEGVSCTGEPKTFTITVNPSAEVNQPTSQALCNNASTAAVVFTTSNSGGTTTYAWTNSQTSIGLVSSGTGDISAFTAINTGVSPVVATIVVTPTFTHSDISCTGPSKTFTITVNPTGQVDQPLSQALCNNTSTAAVVFATQNSGGITTYTWTNSQTSIGLASGGTGNITAFTAINTGVSPVVATIVVTPTFTYSGISCTGSSKTFTITVNPTEQVNQPSSQTLCNSASTTAVVFTTQNSGGTTTYAWTNDKTSIGLASSGTGNINSFTAINTGTTPVVATIVVTPTFTNSGASCTGSSKTFTFTVNPTGQVNQPSSQAVCNSTSTAVVFSSQNSGGTTTYAWTNSQTSIGLASSGTGNINTFTAVNTGTAPVVATIVVTPTFTYSAISCTGSSKTFTITVNPTGQVDQPSSQTLCNSASTTAVVFTTQNSGGTTTYAWTNDKTSIGLASGGTGNIGSFTAINTGLTPVVASIIVTPTFTNSGISCTGSSKTFTIIVNPTGQVNQPSSQVVCNNTSTAVVFSTQNSGGTTTYAWTNDKTSIGLASNGTGNISAFTAINTGVSPVIATIVVTPTFTNSGVSCTGSSKTFTITVNPTGQVDQPSSQTVCNNASTAAVVFTTQNSGGTTTYAWTNDKTSIGLASGGTGNINAFTAINTGTTPVIASIVVTPTFTYPGMSCTGSSKTFTITVNPTGQVNQPSNQAFCNNTSTSNITFSTQNSGGTTTYSWTNDKTSIGLASSGTGNINAFTVINTGTTPVVASIIVTPTFTNSGISCTGSSKTFTITVNPTGQVDQPSSQTVCNNASTSTVVFTTQNSGGTTTYAWTNDNTSIGLASGGTGSISAFTAINTGLTPVVASIVVTPTFTYSGMSCAGSSKTFTITVNPTGQVNQPLSQVVCNNTSATNVAFSTQNSGGTTTYAWTNDKTSIGLASGGTGSISAFTAINTGLTPVVASIVVTPTFTNSGMSCTGSSKTFTITVNPTGQVNQPSSQVVCNNTSTGVVFSTQNSGGTTTYAWTNDKTSIGLASNGTGNINTFTAINTGLAPVIATIVVTPTFTNSGASCTGSSKTFTITVNPTGQVDQPSSQTVCNNTSTSTIVFTTQNSGGTTTYAWTNDKTSIGLASGGTGNISAFTAINTGTAPVTATIVVTPTFTYPGMSCTGSSKTFTITVNPTGQVNQPSNQALCNNTPTSNIAFITQNSGGTTTYSWTNDKSSIGLASSGTGNIISFTAINTGTTPVVASIVVTPTFTNSDISCTGSSKTFTITVNPTGQTDQPSSQVVCNNTSISTVAFTTQNSGGTTTYSWTNDQSSIGLASSGTGNIISFTAINTGTTPVVASIVVTPTFTNAGISCTGSSKTFTITVNPTGQVDQPTSQVVCNNASTAAVVFATQNSGGATTYSWTNGNTTIGLASSGTGNIIAFTATNTGDSPVVASIVVTPTFTNSDISCTGSSKTFTITVNPTGQVEQPSSRTFCNSASTTTVVFTTQNSGGTTTYSWTNDNTSIGLASSGTGNINSFTALNTGTAPVIATIIVTPTFTYSGRSCTGSTKTFTFTVNPTGQVNDPSDQVLCNGVATSAVAFTTNNTGGATIYTWTNNTISIGLASSGTGSISSFTAVNTGTAPVIATITVTPHFTNAAVTCSGPAESFTITVNPTGQVNDPSDQVVCNGVYTSAVVFTTNNTAGATTYTWTNNVTSIGLAASGTGNISAFAAVNTGTAPVTATITVTPHFTNAGVTCDGPPESFTITVNPTGQVNDPSDQVICNGTSSSAVVFTTINTSGTTTYTWANNTTSIGLAASGSGNISAFTAINTGTAPVTATITVTPHFTNAGVTCDGPTESFTITVNPTGQVNDPADQVVCNGGATSAVAFTTNNTGGATTYTWTNNTISIGLASSGTGSISSFTAVNTGTAPVTATITVTPHFTNAGVTCDGPAQSFTITVNPTGQVNDPSNQVVCNGASTSAVPFTTINTAGTTTYTWTNNTTSIGLASSGTGNITAFTAINTGTTPITATITVTPHFTNAGVTCDGPSESFTITVNPTGQTDQPTSQTLCNNTSTATVVFNTQNSGGTTTYAWTNDKTSIGLASSGTGNINAFTATNTGTAPVIATIVVTPTFTNSGISCTGSSKTFTFTVNPTGQVNQPSNQALCLNTLTTAVVFATQNSGGTTTYAWTNDKTSIGLASSGTGNISAFTATNTGTAPVVASIVVTPTFTNSAISCTGSTKTFTITVNPTGQVNQPSSQVVCNSASTATVVFATQNSGGTTTYAWTNDKTSIGLTSSGTGNISAFTAINTGTSPVIATIVVTPTFTNAGVSCTGSSKTFTITVNPTGQVVQPSSQVVCNNTSTTTVVFTTLNSGGTTTYAWTNDKTSIGLVSSGTGNINAFTAINTGTVPVVASIVVTPTFTNSGSSCTGSSKTFTITVNPTGQVNQPSNQAVCHNTSTTTVVFTTQNTVGTTTYAWTNNNTTIGLASSGTGNISAFTAINSGTTPVVASIVVTPTFTNAGVSCTGSTKTFTITVNPLLTASVTISPSPNDTVCAGTSVTYLATPTNGGTAPAYQWKVNGTAVTGATNATYTYFPTNGNTIYCVLTSSLPCPLGNPATSNTVTMRVNPIIPVSISIVASANPVSVGTPVTFTATPTNGGSSPQYQWKSNGTNVSGATNTTYLLTPTSNSTVNVTCSLTTSMTGCLSGNPVISNTIIFLVASAGDSCPGVADVTIGGKTYNTVQIGVQCWLRENMDIGTMILKGTLPSNNTTIEKYCYNDLASNCAIYGGLYEWNEMMQYVTTEGAQGICPTGWHIPKDTAFSTLSIFLGGNDFSGGKIKETGTTHFYSPNSGATNASGFTALPAGNLYTGTSWGSIRSYGYYNTSTTSPLDPLWNKGRMVSYVNAKTLPINGFKTTSLSVRCMKN